LNDTQNSTPDPRQVLAQELEHWWKSGNHAFRRRRDVACLIGPNAGGMLSSYFNGRMFPTLPICKKLYALTKIPSLEPHKATETIRQLRSERARKIHTPEVAAKVSEGLRKTWARNPRSVAYLHTPEVVNKRNDLLKTPEVKKRHSEGIKASWDTDRRARASERKAQFWVALNSEVRELRAKFEKISKGRTREDQLRQRVRECRALGLTWERVKTQLDQEFGHTRSLDAYRGYMRIPKPTKPE
jgi:hypothetical protein